MEQGKGERAWSRKIPLHEEAEQDPMRGSAVTRRGEKLQEELLPRVALLSGALETLIVGRCHLPTSPRARLAHNSVGQWCQLYWVFQKPEQVLLKRGEPVQLGEAAGAHVWGTGRRRNWESTG